MERKVISPTEMTVVRMQMVAFLREETGCGMFDCKKALQENEWDIIKAKEYLENKEQSLASLITRR